MISLKNSYSATSLLFLSDNSAISASTQSGRAGSLSVDALESIFLTGNSRIASEAEAGGSAGALSLQTTTLSVGDRSSVSVSSTLFGASGNLTIEARDVTLNDRARITAETEAGQGGNVSLIGANSLRISRGSVLSTATGTGRAGDIQLQVRETLTLNERSSISASAAGGRGGDILIRAGQGIPVERVALRARSEITATASGTGRAGDIRVVAENVRISRSAIAVSGAGQSRAGDLTLRAQTVRLQENATIAAETARGRGGNVSLLGADFLSLSGGSTLSASTARGRAGNLNILMAAGGDIDLRGRSRIAAEATRPALRGADPPIAGNLTIRGDRLTVREDSEITVSAPFGQAGSLNISARDMVLNNGRIIAETGFSPRNGQGANIQLRDLDQLLMGNNSLISARALRNANGGNLLIEVNNGYIYALPGENNDIIATAEGGAGGNITIRAIRPFGFIDRTGSQLTFNQLRANDTNDISASSEFGTEGEIVFDIISVDPGQGLAELPETVIDASQQIAPQCQASGITEEELGEFVITGRGGLPPSPDDLQGDAIAPTDLITLDSDAPEPTTAASIEATPTDALPIVEAQGWTVGANGEVTLTAEAVTPMPHAAIAPPVNCIAEE